MHFGRTNIEITNRSETVHVAVASRPQDVRPTRNLTSGSGKVDPTMRSHRRPVLLALEGLMIAAAVSTFFLR